MKASDFNGLVISRMAKCEDVLCKKAEEYSTEEDRLHNFKIAGRARGCSAVKALDGMMTKHLVSMWDIIEQMDIEGNYIPSQELVTEKLGDVLNYILLLEGLIEDRRSVLEEAS